MRIYGYLRASTKEQDAERAKTALLKFAETNNLEVCHFFTENESGNKLHRPELMQLINIAAPGDAILIEQIDRLTRLKLDEWEQLKEILNKKHIRIISLDLPTSHILTNSGDDITNQMITLINRLILDVLALVAYKDYEDRKRRQNDGIKKAKDEGKYKGRPEDKELQERVEILLKQGNSYNEVIKLVGCSRYTVNKVNKRLKAHK